MDAAHDPMESVILSEACAKAKDGDLDRAMELAEALISVDSYSAFALTVFGAGETAAALRVARRLRELQEQALGRDAADVFATRTVIVTLTAQLDQIDDALGLAARLLTDQQRALGADHPDTMRTRSTLAYLNTRKGDLGFGVELYTSLFSDQKRVLGSNDPATRATHHELAFTRLEEAMLLVSDSESPADVHDVVDELSIPDLEDDPELALDQLVDLFVREVAIRGRCHPDVLRVRSLLAQCFEAVGDYLHAYVLAVALLEDQSKLLGAENPDLFQLRFVVGDLMARVGDVDGALGQLKSLLDDERGVLGDAHPNTVVTHHRVVALHVASALHAANVAAKDCHSCHSDEIKDGQFDGRLQSSIDAAETGALIEAVAGALSLLDTQLGILGANHPETIRTSGLLAGWIEKSGGFDALSGALEELLESQRGQLKSNDPRMIDTRRALVVIAAMGDDPAAAAEPLPGLLGDLVDSQGPDHPDTLVLRDQLAERAGSLGALGAVIGLMGGLVAAQSDKLGWTDQETLRTRNILADLVASNGDIEGALDRFVAVLVDQLEELGPDHSDTLVTRWNIASWMGETGDLGFAFPMMQALVEDQDRLAGPASPATLETRYTLASWLARMGRVEEAVEAFEALVVDQRGLFGDDHPDVVRTEDVLARLADVRLSQSAESPEA